MDKHGKTIQLINTFFYGEPGELNWVSIRKLIPANLEGRIKEKYNMLNTNEIRLCCLMLFDVDKKDITHILPLKKNSLSPMVYQIKKKSGINDLKKALMILLH
jgi:hypothetical protein